MGAYFAEPRPAGWRGRPRHTLPTLLQDDAKRIGLSLSSKVDLEAFRALAADRSGGWASVPEWCWHPSFCLLFAYFFFF